MTFSKVLSPLGVQFLLNSDFNPQAVTVIHALANPPPPQTFPDPPRQNTLHSTLGLPHLYPVPGVTPVFPVMPAPCSLAIS